MGHLGSFAFAFAFAGKGIAGLASGPGAGGMALSMPSFGVLGETETVMTPDGDEAAAKTDGGQSHSQFQAQLQEKVQKTTQAVELVGQAFAAATTQAV